MLMTGHSFQESITATASVKKNGLTRDGLHNDSNMPIFPSMQKKSIGDTRCPIARGLEHVGEWWSILILRDAFHGYRRFDEFQKSLGIAPNMLTRRLTSLVESGLLERRLYSERPPRYEYVLTPRGRDFRPVLVTLLAWGNRNFAPEGEALVLIDAETGKQADPVIVDRVSGRPVTERDFVFRPGPAASDRIRRRYAGKPEAGEAAARTKPTRARKTAL